MPLSIPATILRQYFFLFKKLQQINHPEPKTLPYYRHNRKLAYILLCIKFILPLICISGNFDIRISMAINMKKTITIFFAAVAISMVTVFLTAYCNSSNGKLSEVYKNDRNNDGVVDDVYRYTLDIKDNMIKVEIDPNNDGHFHKGCCYNLGAEMNCNLLKKPSGG